MEYNDVGLHEFMDLCRLLDTEPYIAVNTGLGTVEDAAKEVAYCNGSLDTPMGQWRSKNGHAESFKVKFWAVGNEMYGGWQLGHMSLKDYVKKHNQVAEAMWKVDPKIQLVAVGAVGPPGPDHRGDQCFMGYAPVDSGFQRPQTGPNGRAMVHCRQKSSGLQ